MVHGVVREYEVRDIRNVWVRRLGFGTRSLGQQLTDAGLDVAVRELLRVQCIVDILAACARVSQALNSERVRIPGGSMLQMISPRKSSLSLHAPLSTAVSSGRGGTTHESPSGGRHDNTAAPKGR